MTTLPELRDRLRIDLAGSGMQVFDHVPTGFIPPAALIAAGDPYVERGDLLGPVSMRVHLEVVLVAGVGLNAQVTAALDDMITRAILHTPDWSLDAVGAPFTTTEGTSNFLACRVSVSQVFDISEGVL